MKVNLFGAYLSTSLGCNETALSVSAVEATQIQDGRVHAKMYTDVQTLQLADSVGAVSLSSTQGACLGATIVVISFPVRPRGALLPTRALDPCFVVVRPM